MRDFKPGDKIWACAYEFDNKKIVKSNIKPTLGILTDGWNDVTGDKVCYFTTMKKDGTPSRSKKVFPKAREYADTEEECIKLYNGLVQKKIDYFQQRIEEVKKEFIEEDFV